MAVRTDYWLEAYTDRLKVDVKYASEDEDYIKEVDVEQYLEELKQGFLIFAVMGLNSALRFSHFFQSFLEQTGSVMNKYSQ